MRAALIGYTGFVGGNLQAQYQFTDFYNSKNFQDMANQAYDLVVCAGVSAKKWLANKEPQADKAAIVELENVLSTIQAKTFVLVSTVDVYPSPIGVDEDTVIDRGICQPYGLHRLELEDFVANTFENHLVVRLPGLFGDGLRKNVIYDFLHNNALEMIHQDGIFQFYNLDYIWRDINTFLNAGVRLGNISGEPVAVQDIVDIFQNGFTNDKPVPGPRYDYFTKHASLWGAGKTKYQYSKAEVLADIAKFVAKEKVRLATEQA